MGGTEVSGHLTNSKPSLTATGVSAGTIFIKIIVHLLGTYISECMTCLKIKKEKRGGGGQMRDSTKSYLALMVQGPEDQGRR